MMVSRRDFLGRSAKAVAFAGVTFLGLEPILSGCARYDPHGIAPEKFDIKKFRNWYKRTKLYNKSNPNLKGSHVSYAVFKDNFVAGWTPGISYTVLWGERMVAVAPGQVMKIEDLHTGRAGGMMVTIGHPNGKKRVSMPHMVEQPPFLSYYAHLWKVYVELGQLVRRGDKIGNVTEHHRYAKLMLKEGGVFGNWVDPDNYGHNHSYMNYTSGALEVDEIYMSNPKSIVEKLSKQVGLLIEFDNFRNERQDDILHLKWHKETGHAPCKWSTLEQFKYLEIMYQIAPQLFPDLNEEAYEKMRKEFYENQPIVLTLPFRRT